MTETTPFIEGASFTDPIVHLSPIASVQLINNRVRIEPKYITNPMWNDTHTGLNSCDGIKVPASELTKQIELALQKEPEAQDAIDDILFAELGSPQSPIEPLAGIKAGINKYEHLIDYAKKGEQLVPLPLVRDALIRQLSFLQGLRYFINTSPQSLSKRIINCIPEQNTLQEYEERLRRLDTDANPYLSPEDQITLLTPALQPLQTVQFAPLSAEDKRIIDATIKDTADGMS